MLLLGPILIVLACGIISGLTYVYFRILLPMLAGSDWVYTHGELGDYWKERGYAAANNASTDADEKISILQSTLLALSTPTGILHTTLVTFFLLNIMYNYYKCVTTSNTGPSYEIVVRELATATGFNYPETEEEMGICKSELDKSIFVRLEKRRREMFNGASNGSNGNATNTVNGDVESQSLNNAPPNNPTTSNNTKMTPPPKIHAWQLLSPQEWTWCRNSKQPKPPRSHYDHVTKSLVLNMDHYCPWMFNVVGYFNYRYFFNFLVWVTAALLYGMGICYQPFIEMSGSGYKEQIRSSGYDGSIKSAKGLVVKHLKSNAYIPTPEEKTPIAFAFMMCLAVGLAVFCLASFHLYLVLSAQTTIEFHGNVSKRRKGGWKNPYSAGSRWRNWEMIYGTGCVDENDGNDRRNRGFWGVILAMMPSSREPEFLPIPVDGMLLRRKNGGDVADKKEDVELGFPRRSNVNLDEESDHSALNGTNGLKERAVRRSPEAAEMIV
jgi:palmitoyltransferase